MTFFVSHSIKVWHGLLDAIVDSTLLNYNSFEHAPSGSDTRTVSITTVEAKRKSQMLL